MTQHTPCTICEWCLFNLKWHGRAYESLCNGVLETQWNKLVEDFPLEAAHLKGLSGLARALLAKIEGR